MRVPALVVGLALLTGTAAADGDNRPQDRFAFALSANNATNGTSAGLGTPVDPISGLAWETSYWPNDYFGLAYDFEFVQIPAASGGSMRTMLASTSTGFGAAAFVAIPLCYVQPYVGMWGDSATALADLLGQESLPAFERRLRRYTSPDLLVLDELGYLPCDTRAADILYNIISRRHEQRSTIITTKSRIQAVGQHVPRTPVRRNSR